VRRLLWTVALCTAGVGTLWAAERASKDTPAAAKTRKKLKQKLSVDFKDTRLRDVAITIQKELDNRVSIKLDNDGGVSNNLTITYSADNKPLEVIFDEMFAKNQLGYVVISNARDRRDGFIIIKKGKQRGYEAGAEPSNTAAKDREKPDADKPAKKEKEPLKKDAAKKDKPARDKSARDGAARDKAVKSKDKAARDKGEEDADKAEAEAARKLKLYRSLQQDGEAQKNRKLIIKARERYKELIKAYPNTKAAEEAKQLLKKLEK
jgi:hypothetical protein